MVLDAYEITSLQSLCATIAKNNVHAPIQDNEIAVLGKMLQWPDDKLFPGTLPSVPHLPESSGPVDRVVPCVDHPIPWGSPVTSLFLTPNHLLFTPLFQEKR